MPTETFDGSGFARKLLDSALVVTPPTWAEDSMLWIQRTATLSRADGALWLTGTSDSERLQLITGALIQACRSVGIYVPGNRPFERAECLCRAVEVLALLDTSLWPKLLELRRLWRGFSCFGFTFEGLPEHWLMDSKEVEAMIDGSDRGHIDTGLNLYRPPLIITASSDLRSSLEKNTRSGVEIYRSKHLEGWGISRAILNMILLGLVLADRKILLEAAGIAKSYGAGGSVHDFHGTLALQVSAMVHRWLNEQKPSKQELAVTRAAGIACLAAADERAPNTDWSVSQDEYSLALWLLLSSGAKPTDRHVRRAKAALLECFADYAESERAKAPSREASGD